MSMTRKDFNSLADELAAVRPTRKTHARFNTWYKSVQAVMIVCAASNPAFDRMRFYAACETRRSFEG